jgi:hypothetical protein
MIWPRDHSFNHNMYRVLDSNLWGRRGQHEHLPIAQTLHIINRAGQDRFPVASSPLVWVYSVGGECLGQGIGWGRCACFDRGSLCRCIYKWKPIPTVYPLHPRSTYTLLAKYKIFDLSISTLPLFPTPPPLLLKTSDLNPTVRMQFKGLALALAALASVASAEK